MLYTDFIRKINFCGYPFMCFAGIGYRHRQKDLRRISYFYISIKHISKRIFRNPFLKTRKYSFKTAVEVSLK